MSTILTIADLKDLARRRVPKMFFDYADSGAWTESTYRANEEDFQKIKFRQRVLVDMDNRSLESTMIGEKVAMPVALAPTGIDRHAACRRRDAGGAGGRGIRRAVHPVDDEHLLDRGRRRRQRRSRSGSSSMCMRDTRFRARPYRPGEGGEMLGAGADARPADPRPAPQGSPQRPFGAAEADVEEHP